jgi:glyoxylase-like metal-dependent hydrolase (beta-lactamase superfamily II)
MACASPSALPKNAAVVLAHADKFAHADARVGTYVASDWGFATNSFWIEGPTGLVLIDTQFLLSAANEAVDWAERATGKKVALAIVLHANPDKFNGTAVLQKRGIRVVTSKQVLDLIPEVHAKRTRAFYTRYAPDYPKDQPRPESFGDRDADISAGGVTVKAHVVAAGCSDAHVVIEWEKHVFVGDLIGSQTHSWLELARLNEWHDRLKELRALSPLYVHPGRGPTGGPELIDAEDAYLHRFEDVVAAEHPQGAPSAEIVARMKTTLQKAYPDYAYDVFLEMGLTAVWTKLAR